jgi:hypothetical protein
MIVRYNNWPLPPQGLYVEDLGFLNRSSSNTFVVLIDEQEPNGTLVNGYDLGFYMEWVFLGFVVSGSIGS